MPALPAKPWELLPSRSGASGRGWAPGGTLGGEGFYLLLIFCFHRLRKNSSSAVDAMHNRIGCALTANSAAAAG